MGGLNLEKMREKHLAMKKHKQDKAKKAASTAEPPGTVLERATKMREDQGSVVPPRMIDLYGDPAVSFEVKDKRREAWIAILTGSKKSAAYKSLSRKLGSAFSRIYERYRREAERRLKGKALYHMFDTEWKKCEFVGMMCIIKGITPTALISYWDSNIQNFADGSILIPPLGFLASPSNVDAAAVAALSQGPRRKKSKPDDVTKRNTYADIVGLDPRLRPGLERGGFSTQKYSDRYLLTVQHNALALARGADLLLASGKLRRMCEWAARNLYKDAAA